MPFVLDAMFAAFHTPWLLRLQTLRSRGIPSWEFLVQRQLPSSFSSRRSFLRPETPVNNDSSGYTVVAAYVHLKSTDHAHGMGLSMGIGILLGKFGRAAKIGRSKQWSERVSPFRPPVICSEATLSLSTLVRSQRQHFGPWTLSSQPRQGNTGRDPEAARGVIRCRYLPVTSDATTKRS